MSYKSLKYHGMAKCRVEERWRREFQRGPPYTHPVPDIYSLHTGRDDVKNKGACRYHDGLLPVVCG